MSVRAGLFEETEDFDISGFTPKTNVRSMEPASESVRTVSEGANFHSREPVATSAAKPVDVKQRRRRTGRNRQLNLKVDTATFESFYEITDRHGWVLGETLQKAVAALRRELGENK